MSGFGSMYVIYLNIKYFEAVVLLLHTNQRSCVNIDHNYLFKLSTKIKTCVSWISHPKMMFRVDANNLIDFTGQS